MRIIKGVYCLTFPNGKRYVGIGCGKQGVNYRWTAYKGYRCSDQPKLYNALQKYGSHNVTYQVVLETDDSEKAKQLEKQLIAIWNLQSDKYGYNMTAGGDGHYGYIPSKETRKKMSERMKNNKWSDEVKKKMSIAAMGRKRENLHMFKTHYFIKDGVVIEIKDLHKYCLKNNLQYAPMVSLKNDKYKSRGKIIKSYKGYSKYEGDTNAT